MIDVTKDWQTQLFEPVRGLFEDKGALYGHYRYKNGHWVSDIWNAVDGKNQYPDIKRNLIPLEADLDGCHAIMYATITGRMLSLNKFLYLLDIPFDQGDLVVIDKKKYDPFAEQKLAWDLLGLDHKIKVLVESKNKIYWIKIAHNQD